MASAQTARARSAGMVRIGSFTCGRAHIIAEVSADHMFYVFDANGDRTYRSGRATCDAGARGGAVGALLMLYGEAQYRNRRPGYLVFSIIRTTPAETVRIGGPGLESVIYREDLTADELPRAYRCPRCAGLNDGLGKRILEFSDHSVYECEACRHSFQVRPGRV